VKKTSGLGLENWR